MPCTSTDGCSLYYETDGYGQTVAFVNDVGYGAWSWGWQYASLCGPFEVVVFDPRGTGRSDFPPGPYSVSQLSADFESVLSDHSARRVHLIGVGLGGMVALAYASAFNRARSLTLIGTALDGGRVDASVLDVMGGTSADSLAPCFSEEFFEEQRGVIDWIIDWRREEDAGADARSAQIAAMQEFACASPYEITIPALVLHGTEDPLIPFAAGEELARNLPNGRFEPLDGRHLAHVESSKRANDSISGFLDSIDNS